MPSLQVCVRAYPTQPKPYDAQLVKLDIEKRQHYVKRREEHPDACALIVTIAPFTDEEYHNIKASIAEKGDEGKRYHVTEGPLYYSEIMSDVLRTLRAIDRDKSHSKPILNT